MSSHPGNTSRSLTDAELVFLRDVRVPFMQNLLKSLEVRLISWSARDIENARRARDDLDGIQNSRKVYDGRAAALLNPGFIRAKKTEDEALAACAAARETPTPLWSAVAKGATATGDTALDNSRNTSDTESGVAGLRPLPPHSKDSAASA